VQAPAPLNVGCPAGYVLNGISNNQPVCTQQDNASARACGEPTNSWGYNTSGVGAGPWPEGSTISQFDGSGGGGCARYGVYKTCVNGQWIASGTWCDENTPPYSGGGG
jgi:hypothetical protein